MSVKTVEPSPEILSQEAWGNLMFEIVEKFSNVMSDAATLPFSIVADIMTSNGSLVGRTESYTVVKSRRLCSGYLDALKALAE